MCRCNPKIFFITNPPIRHYAPWSPKCSRQHHHVYTIQRAQPQTKAVDIANSTRVAADYRRFILWRHYFPCELQDRGFIECVTPGAFSRKIRHAAEWRLTHLVCDASGRLPGKPFMRWRPTEKQNTVSIRSVTVANESQSPSIKWSDRL